MKVAELKKILNKYSDDKQVLFTLQGAKHYFWADVCTKSEHGDNPVIEAVDSVNFDDIVGMAEACLDDPYNSLGVLETDCLKDFLYEAKEITK